MNNPFLHLRLRYAPWLFALQVASSAVYGQTRVVINADLGRDTINRDIYGHFAEHLGRCIYGGFYVGDNNLRIPHTRGIRNDVVAALRRLKIPNLRWPGGCFADTYHWKDGIGPKDKRPTMVNSWWGGVTEDNSFGTHEFLDLCDQIGAEPYITGNVGSGTVQELSQWVQYVTFDGKSPMADLRAANGRAKPWRVRYWGVGNETWGCGGNMTAEYYANIYRQYATFMTSGWHDASVFRIASGAGSGDYHWTEVLMRDIPHGMLEGIALHHYAVIDWKKKSSATDFTETEYALSLQQAMRMDELIRGHATIMDRYDPKKKVALVVDEWGGWYDVEPGTNPGFLYQQNTMRDAMIAGMTLNIFNNHCDRVRMANLAQTVNVLQAVVLTDEEKMILTPTYHVMEMYAVHQDAVLLPVDVRGALAGMEAAKLPAVSVSASRADDGMINVSLVNIDPHASQEVKLDLRGTTVSGVHGRILVGRSIQDHNTFDAPESVKPTSFTSATIEGRSVRVQLPPCSVVVLSMR